MSASGSSSSSGSLTGFTDRGNWAVAAGGSITTITFEGLPDGEPARFQLQSQGVSEVTGGSLMQMGHLPQFVTASSSLPFPMFTEGTLPTEPNFISNDLASPVFATGWTTFHFSNPTTATGAFVADGGPLGNFEIEVFDLGLSLGFISVSPRTLPDSFVGVVSAVPFTSARFRPTNSFDSWGLDCVEHVGGLESDCAGGQINDDGSGESGLGWNPVTNFQVEVVVPFTPPEYPYTYDQICLTWTQTNVIDPDISFNLVMYDDDGSGGEPGTLLASVPAFATGVPVFSSISPFFSYSVELPQIASGGVYLGVEWDPSVEQAYFVGADLSHDFTDYHRIDQTTWSLDLGGVQTLMIRADGFGAEGNLNSRNSGPNPHSLTGTLPTIGAKQTLAVDLSTTGHSLALVAGFRSGLTQILPGGQVLLQDVLDPAGEILGLSPQPGPLAIFEIDVPASIELVGLGMSIQAIHIGAVTPFALSNALDVVVGR